MRRVNGARGPPTSVLGPTVAAPEPPASAGTFAVRDRRFWATDEAAAAITGAAPAAVTGAAPAATAGDRAAASDEPAPRWPTYVEQLQAELEAARADAAAKDARLREHLAAAQEQVARGVEEATARLARDAEKQLGRARGELATGLLEVLDNLQRALLAAEQSQSFAALLAGLRQVEAQFVARLGALGLERIPAAGERFDPAVHEAVSVVPAAGAADDGAVVAEVQPGFRCGVDVVRPARVVVAKRAG